MEITKELALELGVSMTDLFYLYKVLYKLPDVDIEGLESKGYLQFNAVSDSIARKLIPQKTPFDTIYDSYPHKIGTRVLKAVKHDTGDYSYCTSKFNYYVRKNPDVASKMLKGLKMELQMREKGNSQQFQQDIKTWFNQRTWEKYCDLEIEEEIEKYDAI